MIEYWGFKRDLRKKIFSIAVLSIVIAWQIASAQEAGLHKAGPVSAKEKVSVAGRKFDVVSIRLSEPGSSFVNGVGRDDYISKSLPLIVTIAMAYFPAAYHSRERIVGAPDWVWHTQYNFIGKVAPADLAEWGREKEHSSSMVDSPLLEAMLQNALADRCKLVVHLVPAEVQGYALVFDKHGPNWKALKATKPGEPDPPKAVGIPGGGKLVPIMPGAEPVVTYINTSMASFSAHVAQMLGTPVENRTGLSGSYDFKLRRFDNESDRVSMWDWGALGLKLERIKVQSNVLVIDHIEKPSPN